MQDFRELLGSLGVTVAWLARKTRVDESHVFHVLAGRRNPSDQVVERWAKALRIDQEALREAIEETRRRVGVS